jgi:anthranilate synthase component 2
MDGIIGPVRTCMILLIDNYDSFTYNLAQYMGELGAELQVRRNDALSVEDIRQLNPSAIVISPGPCTPDEAGISVDTVQQLGARLPILGVCLGHQSIGQAYGARVERAPEIMHGKTSMIHHNDKGVFKGVSNPFTATRYHSLILNRDSIPPCLQVTAWTEEPHKLVMGIHHREHRVQGVQFHPESILTSAGKKLLANFLESF